MNEALFQFIWKMQLFDHNGLQTTDGELITILHPGLQNQDAGPDFSQARIRIGKTIWAGNVELHLRSSQWSDHGHQYDPAYRNVILHVVLEQNSKIPDLPTLTLSDRIRPELLRKHEQWMHSGRWIPCSGSIPLPGGADIRSWLDRLTIERLEDKVSGYRQRLEINRGDWNETAWQLIARSLGNPVNAEPMEQLARSTPLVFLQRYQHDRTMVESILLGQAGMLEGGFRELIPHDMQSRYRHVQKLHRLEPMEPGQWKFGRLRPAHFPGVRISQLAALAIKQPGLFNSLIETAASELSGLLEVEASAYWKEHVHLKRITTSRSARLGHSTISSILINSVAPLYLLWGQEQGDDRWIDRATDLLHHLPAENNRVIKNWKAHGLEPAHAADSQALLQLFKNYCNQKRCLSCHIGYRHLHKVTYI